mmetsp:Transcript_16375/g.27039  ORF Transcript_16375/g.27039 Transcript_16375/m.27039 type:complete len:293 (+) Transcript_16375:449-1327(+)
MMRWPLASLSNWVKHSLISLSCSGGTWECCWARISFSRRVLLSWMAARRELALAERARKVRLVCLLSETPALWRSWSRALRAERASASNLTALRAASCCWTSPSSEEACTAPRLSSTWAEKVAAEEANWRRSCSLFCWEASSWSSWAAREPRRSPTLANWATTSSMVNSDKGFSLIPAATRVAENSTRASFSWALAPYSDWTREADSCSSTTASTEETATGSLRTSKADWSHTPRTLALLANWILRSSRCCCCWASARAAAVEFLRARAWSRSSRVWRTKAVYADQRAERTG